MTRMIWTAAIAVLAIAAPSIRAQGIEGTWKVTYVTLGAIENTVAIVKAKVQDGKATGELVAGATRFKGLEFKSLKQEGDTVSVVINVGTNVLTFEGAVPKKATKEVRGVLSIDGTLYPAMMIATEDTTLDAKSSLRLLDCPPMQQARTLNQQAQLLQSQALQSKDAEKRKDLLKRASEASKKAKAESPKLYREVLDKHAESPAALEAALNLIKGAKSSDARSDDVKVWATTGTKVAKLYGPRMELDYATQVATALMGVDDMEKLALEYARQAEKSLSPQAPASDQVKVLGILVKALKKTGANDEAKTFDTRMEKLDLILDKEYSVKYPGFKGTAYTGRKSASDRAVFMELFTGATCPPCVAADLAFDVLHKSYKPTELVLIQYHLHIPGPDPMTNPDTQARWDYYRKTFAAQVKGVPCSIFDGKPATKPAQSGGGFADAETKYGAYVDVINPLLEENSGAKLNIEAKRDGERIDIAVKVSGVANPDADKKLRILIAEETIRYAGSNKIRLHHNVVRSFAGGVEGIALKEAASRHKTSIHLGNLRTDLTRYLDNFEATVRPFANPARPLAFDNLRVIAFVQDDNTLEILQAAQVEIGK